MFCFVVLDEVLQRSKNCLINEGEGGEMFRKHIYQLYSIYCMLINKQMMESCDGPLFRSECLTQGLVEMYAIIRWLCAEGCWGGRDHFHIGNFLLRESSRSRQQATTADRSRFPFGRAQEGAEIQTKANIALLLPSHVSLLASQGITHLTQANALRLP
jgi:hypothetical protein